VAKNPQFKLEIKLYSFVNRSTETSILYIRDIYTMNQCFVTSVTASLRRTTSENMEAKILYFLPKQIKNCELNCTEIAMRP
jgi:hypothetical protein